MILYGKVLKKAYTPNYFSEDLRHVQGVEGNVLKVIYFLARFTLHVQR